MTVSFKDNSDFNRLQRKRIRLAFLPAFVFVVLLWLFFAVDTFLFDDYNFSLLGIYPLLPKGLVGIFVSPFLHASSQHILSNTIPLLVLVWMLFYFYSPIAFRSFAALWLLSGFFTWLIGRSSYHIGASGLVFALIFFLFFSGIFRKHIPLIAVSMVVTFLYGSMLWSIFPVSEYIDASLSWEGHLSGAISGLLVSLLFRKNLPQKTEPDWEEEEDALEDETPSIEDHSDRF